MTDKMNSVFLCFAMFCVTSLTLCCVGITALLVGRMFFGLHCTP